MKTIIRRGNIVDGTGRPAFTGDIVIENDTIIRIGDAGDQEAEQVIDAANRIVCPGFIDTHSHSDLAILETSVILPKIHQGITTEVLGQDGIGMAPLPQQYVQQWRQNLSGLEGVSDHISWDYPTTEQYIRVIEQGRPCSNFAFLIPHGNIRLEVMGFENSWADERQLRQMEDALRREMECGALGMSTGLVYVPCVYAATEELIRLCRIVKAYDGVFVVHQRYESERILDSMAELERIALESGVRLHISHFKISGRHNAEKCDQLFVMLDRFSKEGIAVSFDQYPYAAGSTMLGRIIPPWAHIGGTDHMIMRLQEHAPKERIRHDMLYDYTNWDNMYHACGPAGIVISSVTKEENQKYVGHSLEEIGEMMRLDPIDAAIWLLIDEKNSVGMVNYNGIMECVKRIMKRQEMNVCTDGLLGGRPHPRVYGSFPRFIREFVSNDGILTMEQAIYKMTGASAKAMRLRDRGVLAPAKKADIVIFNKDTIRDTSTYAEPCRYAVGIDTVLVNGKVVLRDGVVNDTACSGAIIRRR